ncbi:MULTISPECIES: hypothetical protein [unclassified Spirosoma]|uniref:hypothetical protein n=1 Tax=unclassified Spirosoma TaxID=2621999 RepID=UPI00095ED9C1|nr:MULTISPECIES: hypothetical protein [unclassified Spirosoma]MBN8824947.1 hypothetical protein [Spirosoma sp.]OJW74736.1 MAG: hypothetical protein BGO59_28260 [Spirosoma sp. 48-14]
MKNTFDIYNWHNSLRLRWMVLPVLAYVASWMVAWGVFLFFPILVTVAQYLIFKIHPAVRRPGVWFLTLPVTFYIWTKWGPAMTYSQPNGIMHGVMAYYIGQIINTLFIPLITTRGRPELLLNWLMGCLAAATIWLVSYKLFIADWQADKLSPTRNLALYGIYPGIALIANGVSSFFFTKQIIKD